MATKMAKIYQALSLGCWIKSRICFFVLVAIVFCCNWSFGQSLSNANRADEVSSKDQRTLRAFPEIKAAVASVSPIIDKAARNHAERQITGSNNFKGVKITSRDRSSNSKLRSIAHDRGAIDVVTRNMSVDSPRISKAVGSGYLTIHEVPKTPSPRQDLHVLYQNGHLVGKSNMLPRATGEHIHVQPDFNKRLHAAASGSVNYQNQAANSGSQSTPKGFCGSGGCTAK
jgi:hypothetical protein